MDFKGVGVWFNQMVDLERIVQLAHDKKIQWITAIMAPDQEAVQLNRKEWTEWRARMPFVKFAAWFVCDDPVQDYASIEYVLGNCTCDGMVLNCEKSYEGAGKWKGKTLMDLLRPKWGGFPKLLSYPSLADIYDMDYRSFSLGGCVFAPQAYFNEYAWATPRAMYDSCVRPMQLHVGQDYRIRPNALPIRWGRIVAWDGNSWATIRDLRSTKLFKVKVVPKVDGNYHYMVISTDRQYYDYQTGRVLAGKVLGFQDSTMVFPTVASYGNYPCAPSEISQKLKALPTLKGSSLYLGDTSQSAHVEAVYDGIN